ncbi:ATP-binding cassette domain-containing protein [Epibacterium ulvae]|uniref:ATP-binding cassette domain-containing protein n=1 Tax=Epibacterium ulvae TaxID=1156985 RepID=UPI0024935E41|nr:ATP-binding cassette domain-containing protein [Epibacterium ulvae]
MSTQQFTVQNLATGYGDLQVLQDISFDVGAGECLCIAGRNGVGKTTLMRALSGELPLISGGIQMQGTEISTLPANRRHGLGLSYGPQDSVTFAPLSVKENLTLHYQDQNLERYEHLFALFPRIRERLEQSAGSLSGGERKILSFTRVMAEDAQVVLLDEPTEGVAPENIDHMATVIRSTLQAGHSVVVVEQNLSLIEAIADRVIVMDHGAIIHETTNGTELRNEISNLLKV